MPEDKFLSIAQAAALTGSTKNALYRKVERGQIPYRKWGRRVLIKESELFAHIDALPGKRLEDVRR